MPVASPPERPPLIPPPKTRRKIWKSATVFWAGIGVVFAILAVGWNLKDSFGAVVSAPERLDKIEKDVSAIKAQNATRDAVYDAQLEHLHEEIREQRQDFRWSQQGRTLPDLGPAHPLPAATTPGEGSPAPTATP